MGECVSIMVKIYLVRLSSMCNNHILVHHSIQERHRDLTWAEFRLKGVHLRRFHCIINLGACFRNLHRNLNPRAFTKEAWTIKTSSTVQSPNVKCTHWSNLNQAANQNLLRPDLRTNGHPASHPVQVLAAGLPQEEDGQLRQHADDGQLQQQRWSPRWHGV